MFGFGRRRGAWVVGGLLFTLLLSSGTAFGSTRQSGSHSSSSSKGLAGACAKVATAARAVLAADDQYLKATTAKQENAALASEDAAIDKLRVPLHGCDPASVPSACAGLISTAQTVVSTEDRYDRAQDEQAENAALAQQDPAVAELKVRLDDCDSGKVPEPCAASIAAARRVLVYEDKYQLAKTEKAENVALAGQDRAIAELKVRLAGCQAAPVATACPTVLEAGQSVVAAEDKFHAASSDADSDAALDEESAAIEALNSAVASCGHG